jgi:hypothetical protein
MFSNPTAEKLAELWKRSSAIVCRNNNPGCDLVIPVLCIKPDEDILKVFVDSTRMTVVALQVKCYSAPISEKERRELCGVAIKRTHCAVDMNTSLPFFSGLIELRGSKLVRVYPAKNKQHSFALVGLKPTDVMTVESHESDELDKAFAELEKARYDPKYNPEHIHLPMSAKEAVSQAFENNFGIAYD